MIALMLAAAISWPVRYNAGVVAYQSNDFVSAASAFEEATASPDRVLQERAHYNLGNAAYRRGEFQPPQAQQLWQNAVKSYETALALDPNDADAKFNRDLVKKKLEELQKKQEEQQKQDKQDKQDKKNQQKKEQQQDGQQQDQQQKPEEQKPDQQQQPPQQTKQDQQPQSQPSPQPNTLDKQQAAALLDNLREEERNWNFFPEMQMKDLKDNNEPGKDW